MADYIKKAPDSKFVDLVDDIEFKKDLVRFFSGGRYMYSKEEMKERGYEGLTADFVEHMRGQSWNEVTALRDLSYVRNKDMDERGKEAFSRLTQAWDSSEEVGSTWGEAIGDFAEAVSTAPSTYVGLGSFGLGKVGSKAAGKATQLAVRAGLKTAAKKNLTKAAVNRTLTQTAAKEAAIGFGTGAAFGGVQSYGAGETREEIKATGEYTAKDLVYDTVIGGVVEGTVGAGLGALSGTFGRSTAKNVEDVLLKRKTAFQAEAEKAADLSLKTLEDATPEEGSAAMGVVSDIEAILSARRGTSKEGIKDPLDPQRVSKGKAMLAAMSDKTSNPEFSSGLSAQTMRGIAAAAVDLQRSMELKTEGGTLRITESVANMMRDGKGSEAFDILDKVKDKYGLSKDEMSLIYMAEASRAGQILGFASAIKRGAKINLEQASDIDVLFSKGASSISGQDAKEISAAAMRNQKSPFFRFLQDMDSLRVSLMTSQPTTTMRNVASTGILVGADMSDQVFKAIFKGITGDTTAIRNIIPDTTAILRGLTTNKTEAALLKQIMLDELPEQSAKLYNDVMRLELGAESNSAIAKVGRAVNFANTLTDTVAKETIFYGSLDRQFREKGLSLTDWLRSNTKLDNLPEGISLDAATKDANSMTMQDTFADSDTVVGNTTRALVRWNRKYPFLVSTAAGIPFPRYLGNHLQKMSEYAPLFGEALYKAGVVDGAEDAATRYAKQATGALILWGGYELAEQRKGEVDYGSIKNTLIQEAGRDADLKPLLGATMLHMYVGDQIWRSQNGLSTAFDNPEQFGKDMADVFGGIPEFSFELGLATGPVIAAITGGEGAASETLRRKLGDFVATYTMNPVTTLSRDIIGQVSYDQAGAPFTRDLAEGEGVSLKGEGVSWAEFGSRATRFLPDFLFLQYSQSLNGETDIPYYDFDNPVARGKIDPFIKQITGVTAEPPATALQEEMSKYGLKNYQLYTASGTPNANIDLVLRARLAKTMYKKFEDWKANSTEASEQYAGLTYNEIVADDRIDAKDKSEILKNWITGEINAERKKVEEVFDDFLAKKPVQARGFVRNNYAIYANQGRGKGARNLDKASMKLNGISADEYLAGSETMQDEVERRMKLLTTVESLPDL